MIFIYSFSHPMKRTDNDLYDLVKYREKQKKIICKRLILFQAALLPWRRLSPVQNCRTVTE
jgi:hypothetical protein